MQEIMNVLLSHLQNGDNNFRIPNKNNGSLYVFTHQVDRKIKIVYGVVEDPDIKGIPALSKYSGYDPLDLGVYKNGQFICSNFYTVFSLYDKQKYKKSDRLITFGDWCEEQNKKISCLYSTKVASLTPREKQVKKFLKELDSDEDPHTMQTLHYFQADPRYHLSSVNHLLQSCDTQVYTWDATVKNLMLDLQTPEEIANEQFEKVKEELQHAIDYEAACKKWAELHPNAALRGAYCTVKALMENEGAKSLKIKLMDQWYSVKDLQCLKAVMINDFKICNVLSQDDSYKVDAAYRAIHGGEGINSYSQLPVESCKYRGKEYVWCT